MSEEREPLRLRDDPTADASLRDALGAAAGERADDAMLERVLAGVLTGGGGGGTSGGGGASAATKIAIGLGGTTMTAVLVALAVHGASIPASPSAAPTPITRDASVVADAGPALVDAWIASDAGTDASETIHAAVHRPPPSSAPPSSVATPAPTETDAQLLFRALRARDPEAGLALLREHRALHPDSASAEDREAQIAIDLARLGRADEARAAAAAFRARWPSSPALPHVEAELERMRSSE